MNLLRLADVDVRGKRVFIRADLNVPQDDAGTDHRRHAHPRVGAGHPGCARRRRRGDGDVAPRPPDGRRVQADDDSLAPVAARLGELLGREVPPDSRLGRRRRRASALAAGESCCSRTAASTRARRRTATSSRSRWRSCATSTCNDAFGTAHRAEATTHGIAQLRAGRLRRPAAGGRARRARQGARRAAAAAGGDRRRLEGVDQADDPASAGSPRSTS